MTRSLLAGLVILAGLGACSDSSGPRTTHTRYVAVAAGNDFTCALDDASNTWCWGSFASINDSVPRLLEVPEQLVEMQASGGFAGALCGRSAASRVYCWGTYLVGDGGHQYGSGFEIPGLPPLRGLALGEGHGCGLGLDSTVSCWGSYTAGKRGQTFPSPLQLFDLVASPHPDSFRFTQLALGGEHSCGILPDGQVACWGDSNFVGNPAGVFLHSEDPCWVFSSACRLNPIAVPGLTGTLKLVASRAHTCALAATGVKCWGDNFALELGSAVGDHSDLPVPVSLPETVVDLALGDENSCALTLSGAAWCWGRLSWNAAPSNPTRFQARGHQFTTLAAGSRHTCGIVEDGAIYCWGDGPALGDGTGKPSQIPVRVAEPRL